MVALPDEASAPAGTVGRLRVAAVVAVSVVVGMLPVFLVGGLTPLIRADFPLDEDQVGLIVGLFFAASSAGSYWAGRRERSPAAQLLRRSLGWLAALAVVAALSARSWWYLALWSIAAGAINGAMQPASNLLLLAHLERRHLGRALGLKQSATPLASLTVGLLIPGVGLTLGWRTSFAVVPLLALVLIATSPRDGAAASRAPHAVIGAAASPIALLLLAAGAGVGAGSGLAGSSFFIVTALERGIAEGTAGLLLATASLINVGTLLLSGVIADRWPRLVTPRTMATMMAVGSSGYAVVALTSDALGLTVGAALAMALGWGWHVIMHLTITSGRFGTAGRATGVAMTGVFAGGFAMPVVYGIVAHGADNVTAWGVLAACVALGSLFFAAAGRAAASAAPTPATPPAVG